jgi:hypothetical protein
MKLILLHILMQPLLWFGSIELQVPSIQGTTRDELASIRDQASKLLDSQNASKRAWGAYLVGQNGFSELEPKLQRLLGAIDAFGLDTCVVRSMLDAEIKMRTPLPQEILTKIYSSYPDEGTILFAQSPSRYPRSILRLFQGERVNARWLALGDMLLEMQAPGFPLVLMQQIKRIDLYVSVIDPKQGEGGVGGSWGEGIDELKVPIDFPPITVYSLSERPKRDAFIIATGPRTIFAIRTVVRPGGNTTIRNGGGYLNGYWDPNVYRLEYLSSMLAVPIDDIKFGRQTRIEWSGPEQFSRDVYSHCNQILQKYDRITSLLQDKGLLTPSDVSSLEPSIRLRISDFRKDKTRPLPEIQLDKVIVEK